MKFNAPQHKIPMMIKYAKHPLFLPFQCVTVPGVPIVPSMCLTVMQPLPTVPVCIVTEVWHVNHTQISDRKFPEI